jgi:hypothetical protein
MKQGDSRGTSLHGHGFEIRHASQNLHAPVAKRSTDHPVVRQEDGLEIAGDDGVGGRISQGPHVVASVAVARGSPQIGAGHGQAPALSTCATRPRIRSSASGVTGPPTEWQPRPFGSSTVTETSASGRR